MKNIFIVVLTSISLFSCTSYNESKNLDNQSAKLAHSKIINLNNDYSFDDYKSLVIEYGKNNKYPTLSE